MIPKRIVAIGTSAFFGFYDPKHGGYLGRLKTWHESLEFENTFYNLGISGETVGETTTQLLERIIPEAKVREPHVILLTSGINDIRRHKNKESSPVTSLEQFEKNIHEMISRARSVARDVIFISTFPIVEKRDSSGNYLLPEDLQVYSEIVKKVCSEENVAYFDIYSDWMQKDYKKFLFSDGVHANEQGHEQIFEKLKEFLLDRYK